MIWSRGRDGDGAPRRVPALDDTSSGAADQSPKPSLDAIAAADPYAFEIAHKRLAWLLRISAMGNVGLLGLVFVLGGTIAQMVPLKTVDVGLVRIEGDTDKLTPVEAASRVRVLPITRDTEGFELLRESFVRRYTRTLLEIDGPSQDDRMTEANRHSDMEFWKRFIDARKKEIQDAIASRLNRSIVIESASRISEREGTARYLVAFEQIDSRDGKPIESKKLHAYVAVASRPRTVRPDERFENPLGFVVVDLAIKIRGAS